jgi:hypothetical protein
MAFCIMGKLGGLPVFSYTILSFVNANVTIIKKMFIGYKCKMGYTASAKGKKPLSER